MPTLATITTPTGKPGKTIDAVVAAIVEAAATEQAAKLAAEGKYAHVPKNGAPSKTAVVWTEHEYRRPNGEVGIFIEAECIDADGNHWRRVIDPTDPTSEFNRPWEMDTGEP